MLATAIALLAAPSCRSVQPPPAPAASPEVVAVLEGYAARPERLERAELALIESWFTDVGATGRTRETRILLRDGVVEASARRDVWDHGEDGARSVSLGGDEGRRVFARALAMLGEAGWWRLPASLPDLEDRPMFEARAQQVLISVSGGEGSATLRLSLPYGYGDTQEHGARAQALDEIFKLVGSE